MYGRIRDTTLAVCIAAFIIGSIAGIVASGTAEPDAALRAQLLLPKEAGFWANLWNCARFHGLAVILALSLIGVVGVPLIAGARGFLMCFTVTVIVRSFGSQGIALALASAVPGSLLSVPALLILSARCTEVSGNLCSAALLRANKPPFGKPLTRTILVAAAAVVVSALAETHLGGVLVAAAAKGIAG